MKTLVLGLGNTILTDDGVGIYVARQLAAEISDPQVDVVEASLAGFNLLDLVVGYDRLIIVDSVVAGVVPGGTGDAPAADIQAGEVMELDPESLRSTLRLSSIHDLNLATALEFGRQMGLHMPHDIRIFVIAARDTTTFGETCTPEVAAAIPVAVAAVKEVLAGRPPQ